MSTLETRAAPSTTRTTASGLSRAALALVVLVYLALGVAYNAKVPKWNAADEPAHYNYVRHLAEGRGLPVLTADDWNLEYQSALISAHFPAGSSIDPIRYEYWQPPLYYLAQAPVYLLTAGAGLDTQVFAMRLFSTALGALLLLLVYAVAAELFPRNRWLPVMAAAFVGFVPMYGAVNASISNDSLANLLLTAIVFVLVVAANPARRDGRSRGVLSSLAAGAWTAPIVLGLLLGLAFITKSTTYLSVGLIAVGAIWATPRPWRVTWPRALRSLVVTYLIALALGGWWFVRNALVYGHFDITGARNHDLVTVGQPRTGVFDWETASNLLETGFHSFWAQFGWMGVPADARTYTLLTILSALIILGLVIFLVRAVMGHVPVSTYQWQGLGLLALTLVLANAAFLYYNLAFLQPQGRYLFPAMVSIGLFSSLGLGHLAPRRFSPLVFGVITLALIALNLLCIFRMIGPAFGT